MNWVITVQDDDFEYAKNDSAIMERLSSGLKKKYLSVLLQEKNNSDRYIKLFYNGKLLRLTYAGSYYRLDRQMDQEMLVREKIVEILDAFTEDRLDSAILALEMGKQSGFQEEGSVNGFGGWLRFYYVTTILGIILLPVTLIFLFYQSSVTAAFSAFELFILSFYSVVAVFLQVPILRIIKKKESDVPGRIIGFLKILLWANIGYAGFDLGYQWLVAHADIGSKDFWKLLSNDLKGVTASVMWMYYFKQSKRVKAYYGTGAIDPESAELQDPEAGASS